MTLDEARALVERVRELASCPRSDCPADIRAICAALRDAISREAALRKALEAALPHVEARIELLAEATNERPAQWARDQTAVLRIQDTEIEARLQRQHDRAQLAHLKSKLGADAGE